MLVKRYIMDEIKSVRNLRPLRTEFCKSQAFTHIADPESQSGVAKVNVVWARCGDISAQRHMLLCQKGELPTVGRGIVGAPSERGQVSRGLVYDRRRREMDRWYAAAPSVVDILLYRCGEGRAESGGKGLPSNPRAKAVLGFGVFGQCPRGGDCGHKGPGSFLTVWLGFEARTSRGSRPAAPWCPEEATEVVALRNSYRRVNPSVFNWEGASREKNQNLLEVIYIPSIQPGNASGPGIKELESSAGRSRTHPLPPLPVCVHFRNMMETSPGLLCIILTMSHTCVD